MSWLLEQKAKIDKQKAEREIKRSQDRCDSDLRHQKCRERAKLDQNLKLGDLEGKNCWEEVYGKRTLLGKFRSELKNTQLTFFAGETKLGEICYWVEEETEYDSQGCACGTGVFHDATTMWLYLPYTKADGSEAGASLRPYNGRTCYYCGPASEEALSEYLINFVEI